MADSEYFILERGRRFAARGGEKRKGALIRSLILDPTVYGVSSFLNEGAALHPLIPMAIGSGGSGGEVRLKLWLSLLYRFNPKELWFDLDEVDPRFMAGMFGLDDPTGKGAARVRAAFRWLSDHGFIEIDGGRLKKTGRVRVIHEASLYLPSQWREIPRQSPEGKADGTLYKEFPRYNESYVRVPSALWANGWMGYLKASELMVLIFVCKLSENGSHQKVEIKAHRRYERFGLSDAMWRQGVTGLQNRGIVKSFEPAKYKTDPVELRAYDYKMEISLNGRNMDEALAGLIDHAKQIAITAKLGRS